MTWKEFEYLLSGISGDTPLGRVVAIRSESDPDVLKTFSKTEKRIRSEWRSKQAKEKPQKATDDAIEELKQAFIRLAGV